MNHPRQLADPTRAWSVFPDLEPARQPAPSRRLKLLRKTPETVVAPQRAPEAGRHVRASTLSFANMQDYGNLLVNYLKARRAVFIDRLAWQLPQADGMEFDQYDTPLCRWIIVHEYGEIMGGVRLVPTTASVGHYSYMLRDAQNGLLENIPNDVLFFKAPVDDRVWEASRLFITEAVPAHRRAAVQTVLMDEMSRTGRELGATHVIGIVPAVWSRWLRRLGLGAVPVGPKFSIDGTTSQAALFNVSQRYVN
ncbi:MAG: GNAT family N-acetyltransferase [Rhodobacteraceae bacterium]|nr:GNAT family N-acetyltransferase [Paracoccaceae bacterium]